MQTQVEQGLRRGTVAPPAVVRTVGHQQAVGNVAEATGAGLGFAPGRHCLAGRRRTIFAGDPPSDFAQRITAAESRGDPAARLRQGEQLGCVRIERVDEAGDFPPKVGRFAPGGGPVPWVFHRQTQHAAEGVLEVGEAGPDSPAGFQRLFQSLHKAAGGG